MGGILTPGWVVKEESENPSAGIPLEALLEDEADWPRAPQPTDAELCAARASAFRKSSERDLRELAKADSLVAQMFGELGDEEPPAPVRAGSELSKRARSEGRERRLAALGEFCKNEVAGGVSIDELCSYAARTDPSVAADLREAFAAIEA